MAASDVRLTNLQIVNAVLRKLFLNAVSATTQTKQATLMVQFLNEVIADISDSGDWQEMYAETVVSAVSGDSQYELGLNSPIKSILERCTGVSIPPLIRSQF